VTSLPLSPARLERNSWLEARKKCDHEQHISNITNVLTGPKIGRRFAQGDRDGSHQAVSRNKSQWPRSILGPLLPCSTGIHCRRECQRQFVEVSASFCRLHAHKEDELLGKAFDDFTVPRTINIPIIWKLFVWTERMVGIWVFAHRSGTKLFLRYEAFAHEDGLFEAHMELLGAGA
jgi:hypothetical protein